MTQTKTVSLLHFIQTLAYFPVVLNICFTFQGPPGSPGPEVNTNTLQNPLV